MMVVEQEQHTERRDEHQALERGRITAEHSGHPGRDQVLKRTPHHHYLADQ